MPVRNEWGKGVTIETTPWLTVKGASIRAQCGKRTIYRAVERQKLKAARINERGDLRFNPDWVDAWLESLVVQL